MARKLKKTKPLIYVFCEGESEQAYTEFLKDRFKESAVIQYPRKTGLFEMAEDGFKNNVKMRNNIEVLNEIWFFFDTETKDIGKWDSRLKIIKHLRRLRKSPNIRVRLLMTSGCIEYWLMLHYKMYAPPAISVADREKILAELLTKEASYEKGNYAATARIAQNYPTAVVNAKKVLSLLEGIPELTDTDDRNKWLHNNSRTFSTVYEAIEYLENQEEN